MKRYSVILLLIVLFTSCNYYTSPIPLSGSKNSTIDSLLLGKWIVEADNGKAGIYIYPFDKKTYLASYFEFKYDSLNGLKEDILHFKMNNTNIGKDTYYNIQSLSFKSNSEELYSVLKLEVSNNKLAAYILKDEIDTQFVSSVDFQAYVKLNKEVFNNSFDSLFVIKRDTTKMKSFFE